MKLLAVLSIFLSSSLFAEPIGLVLSGGGAKGAYEVGVWKAMVETGVAKNVRVISGASVGALNGALFASVRDPVQIERLWTERIGELMGPIVDDLRADTQDGLDAVADGLRRKNDYIEEHKRKLATARGVLVEDLLPGEVSKIEKEASVRLTFELASRGLSGLLRLREERKRRSTNFHEKLAEVLPKCWSDSVPAVYVTALACRGRKVTRFLLNNETTERRLNEIIASCAIPKLFEPVAIDGVCYQDGGIGIVGDNTPIQPILAQHADLHTIVVVYLDDVRRIGNSRILHADYPRQQIVEVIPSRDSGGLLGCIDPSVDTIKRLVDLGYRDAIQVFRRVMANSK